MLLQCLSGSVDQKNINVSSDFHGYTVQINVYSYNYRPEIILLSPGRLFGINDVTSGMVNFRPDIKENFFLKKIRASRVCVVLKYGAMP